MKWCWLFGHKWVMHTANHRTMWKAWKFCQRCNKEGIL